MSDDQEREVNFHGDDSEFADPSRSRSASSFAPTPASTSNTNHAAVELQPVTVHLPKDHSADPSTNTPPSSSSSAATAGTTESSSSSASAIPPRKLIRQNTPRLEAKNGKNILSSPPPPDEEDENVNTTSAGAVDDEPATGPLSPSAPHHDTNGSTSSTTTSVPLHSPATIVSNMPPVHSILHHHHDPIANNNTNNGNKNVISPAKNPRPSLINRGSAVDSGPTNTNGNGMSPGLLGRSVSEPPQRKGVRFVPGCGGSNEGESTSSGGSNNSISLSSTSSLLGEEHKHNDSTSSLNLSHASDDIRHRGIPEEKHWIYRLLDPDDSEITFKHCNEHPEIWTQELLNDVVTYIRPHDLVATIAKGLRTAGSQLESNVTISFRNLAYTDQNGVLRLQGITGYIRPKMMLCVLGGPDAGITTFLDVLAGRQIGGDVVGELLCDGAPFSKGMNRALGYVTKEDTNLPTLTVRETLLFAGALRQPPRRPELLDLQAKIVCKFMGMLHVIDSIVGNATIRGISGGEKRRLSYACEVMGGHACIIADLPTNGLDSASAYTCLSTIQKGCMAGRSMACSLVQPSPELFRLFSHLLVLSKGAQIYFGPATQVELYLGHHGFRRPSGKELPDFLEELSTTPGKFWRGEPMKPLEYLQAIEANPEDAHKFVDIDSLQATAARMSGSPEYTWTQLTDEDEELLKCSKDDAITKALDVGVLKPPGKQGVSNPLALAKQKGMTASFRQDTPPELSTGSSTPNESPTKANDTAEGGASGGGHARHLTPGASPTLTSSHPSPSHTPQQKKLRGLKNKYKSFNVPSHEAFNDGIPFEEMSTLCQRETELHNQIKQSQEDGTDHLRNHYADSYEQELILQRKWIWMIQCYKRSPIYEKLGQRMFAEMLSAKNEPIPYVSHDPHTNAAMHLTPEERERRGEGLLGDLKKGAQGGKNGGGGGGRPPVKKDFRYHSTIWTQICLTTARQWRITIRNPAFTKGAVIRNILIGLLIGTLFYQVGTSNTDARTRFGLFYFCANFTSFAVVQLIPQLMEQRQVYYHQLASGYFNGIAYYLSFMLTSLPFAFGEIFLFLIFVYPLSNLHGGVGDGRFFYTWLMLFILNLSVRAWVLFVASVSRTQTVAQALAPVSLVLMQIFCGYMVPKSSIPQGWIWMYYLSPFTYSLKGLVINELSGLTFTCPNGIGTLPYHADPRYNVAPPLGFGGRQTCPLQTGDDVLRLYDMDVGVDGDPIEVKWFMILWMFLFFLAFNFIACCALLFINHSTGDSSELPNWSHDVRDHSESIQAPATPRAASSVVPSSQKQKNGNTGEEGEQPQIVINIPRKHLTTKKSSIQPPEAYLSFNNLSYSVILPAGKGKKGKVTRPLLTNCFGFATPKNMIALMGPSGAGKSTLLDVLAGKKTGGIITGDIRINGEPRDDNTFNHIAGYVEQNDSHDPFQTIRDAIEFSATLRLASKFTKEQRDSRVNDVIEALGLEHVQHHMIGDPSIGIPGVSPELRKKTTIAVELVMAPSLLFLDEPTTGLDSAGALAVMHAVSALAQNMSVLCTIHQPSVEIVSLFQSILLLKGQGEIAYFGPIAPLPQEGKRGVVEFFEDPSLFSEYHTFVQPTPYLIDKNRTDFALDAIMAMANDKKENGEVRVNPARQFELTEEYAEIKHILETGAMPPGVGGFGQSYSSANLHSKAFSSPEATDRLTQFYALLHRQSLSNYRNSAIWRSRFFVPTFISLLLGTLYWQLGFNQFALQNRISLMYLIVIFVCFSAAAFLPGIFQFRAIFFRERTSHMYSSSPYWIAKFVAELPYVMIEVMLYCLIMYWISGLTADDHGGRWGYFILALFGTRLAALGFCECLARLVPDIAAATALISVLNTIMGLFTGFLIQKERIPQGWKWMYYVSLFRYPLSFLAANELRDEHFYCTPSEIKYIPTSAAPADESYRCTGADDPNCLPVCPLTLGTQMLDQFSIEYDEDKRGLNLGIIFIFFAGFQLINYWAIKKVNHVKR